MPSDLSILTMVSVSSTGFVSFMTGKTNTLDADASDIIGCVSFTTGKTANSLDADASDIIGCVSQLAGDTLKC